jgi:hypothetical protein
MAICINFCLASLLFWLLSFAVAFCSSFCFCFSFFILKKEEQKSDNSSFFRMKNEKQELSWQKAKATGNRKLPEKQRTVRKQGHNKRKQKVKPHAKDLACFASQM